MSTEVQEKSRWDLTRRVRRRGGLRWVLAALLLVAAAGAAYLFFIRGGAGEVPASTPPHWKRHHFQAQQVSLRLPPDWEWRQSAKGRLRFGREARLRPVSPEPASIVAVLEWAESGSDLERVAQQHAAAVRSQGPEGEALVIMKRRRYLGPLRRYRAIELQVGRKGPLAEAFPDHQRGPVEHRVYIEPPEWIERRGVLLFRYTLPAGAPAVLWDEFESVVSSLRFLPD